MRGDEIMGGILPTRIVDKNGRHTTVYRKPYVVSHKSVQSIPAPVSSAVDYRSGMEPFGSIEQFREYSRRLDGAELSVERFGIGLAPLPLYDSGIEWDGIPDEVLNPNQMIMISSQETVYAATVEHYIDNPNVPSEMGLTRRDGMAVRLLRDFDGSLHIMEGNHRIAAAMISDGYVVAKVFNCSDSDGGDVSDDYY